MGRRSYRHRPIDHQEYQTSVDAGTACSIGRGSRRAAADRYPFRYASGRIPEWIIVDEVPMSGAAYAMGGAWCRV